MDIVVVLFCIDVLRRHYYMVTLLFQLSNSLDVDGFRWIFNIVEPCPSSVFQNHLRDYIELNSEAAIKLIDTMLNQLNWSFSEFIRILHEVNTYYLCFILCTKMPVVCLQFFDIVDQ